MQKKKLFQKVSAIKIKVSGIIIIISKESTGKIRQGQKWENGGGGGGRYEGKITNDEAHVRKYAVPLFFKSDSAFFIT